MKYAADLASCIWKALGFVLRLIYTDYAKYYIAGHWKTGPKGLPAWGAIPPYTHTLEKHRGGGQGTQPPRVPTPKNFSKHLTDWSGVSTVELCGWKKRDLSRILRYVRAQKWGGRNLLLPPFLESGGVSAPLTPPCSYAYVFSKELEVSTTVETDFLSAASVGAESFSSFLVLEHVLAIHLAVSGLPTTFTLFTISDIRAVPEIILGGGHIFFQTPPTPGHTRSQSPLTPRTHKCFN